MMFLVCATGFADTARRAGTWLALAFAAGCAGPPIDWGTSPADVASSSALDADASVAEGPSDAPSAPDIGALSDAPADVSSDAPADVTSTADGAVSQRDAPPVGPDAVDPIVPGDADADAPSPPPSDAGADVDTPDTWLDAVDPPGAVSFLRFQAVELGWIHYLYSGEFLCLLGKATLGPSVEWGAGSVFVRWRGLLSEDCHPPHGVHLEMKASLWTVQIASLADVDGICSDGDTIYDAWVTVPAPPPGTSIAVVAHPHLNGLVTKNPQGKVFCQGCIGGPLPSAVDPQPSPCETDADCGDGRCLPFLKWPSAGNDEPTPKVCYDTQCTPGQTRCLGDALLTCTDDGIAWAHTPCGDSPGTGTCATAGGEAACQASDPPPLCAPGSYCCSGPYVMSCGPGGDAWIESPSCGTACLFQGPLYLPVPPCEP